METKLLAELLMLCGALHDIAEKSNEQNTQRQIGYIEDRIEGLAFKYLPETMSKMKIYV